jgi:hypothetical protein
MIAHEEHVVQQRCARDADIEAGMMRGAAQEILRPGRAALATGDQVRDPAAERESDEQQKAT